MAEHTESARKWVENLLRLAVQPPKIAVETPEYRGPDFTRGPARTRAVAPSSERPSTFAQALEQLYAQPFAMRREVVEQLLRQAREDLPFLVLRTMAVERADADDNLRWVIAEGLETLARPDAVELLEQIARSDPDDTVRMEAIGALGQRALAAYRDKVGEGKADSRVLMRPVRTRGASPVRDVSEAERILETLYRLYNSEGSALVKETADLTLQQLGE